jgi:hypothetical protein
MNFVYAIRAKVRNHTIPKFNLGDIVPIFLNVIFAKIYLTN